MHGSRAGGDAVLVTGASGFLGRHVLQALGGGPAPRRILALVRDDKAWAALDWTSKLDGVELLRGGVDDVAAWRDAPALAGVGCVIHGAALVRHSRRDPEDVYRTNVAGTEAVVGLAAERGWRTLFVSTSGTVGCFASPDEHADEDAPYCTSPVQGWPYYDSKQRAERRARALADAAGAELAVVRPPVLLGPGDHRFRSSSHLIRFLRGRLPFVVRGGMNFADVRDVARALARLVDVSPLRPVYHLPGTECSVEDFFQQAAELSGATPPRLVLPFRPAWLLASALERVGLHWLPDPVVIEMASRWWGLRSRYAEAELGYRVRDPAETLRDTIGWLRRHHEDLA